MKKSDKELIEQLIELKESYGVSYTHIARQIDVSTSAVTNYVRGMVWGLSSDTKREIQKVIDQYPKSVRGD